MNHLSVLFRDVVAAADEKNNNVATGFARRNCIEISNELVQSIVCAEYRAREHSVESEENNEFPRRKLGPYQYVRPLEQRPTGERI